MENSTSRLFLLASLLAKDGVITNNGKALLKEPKTGRSPSLLHLELILARDSRLGDLLSSFKQKDKTDVEFIETVHALIDSEAYVLYDELFEECSLEVGKSLSKGEREEKDLGDIKSLIYGEVDFAYFARILRKMNPAPGGVFYDLGSGTSKAVFISRLLRDFDVCKGIEVLESLHNAAEVVAEKFQERIAEALWSQQEQRVELVCASFLDYDWSDGDVVFANSTCFDDALMADMAREAEKLRPGAFFVTFTKGLASPAFEVLERKRYRMSWGPATVFIHMRRNLDGSSAKDTDLVDIADDDSYDFDDDVDDNADDDDDDDLNDDEEEEHEEADEEEADKDGEFNDLENLTKL